MFKFYDVDANYIHYLKSFDQKVPNLEYKTNNKFVCGVVIDINGINYYAPISHFNKAQHTNFPIKNKGKIISTIRFCFMFPALNSVVHEKVFSDIAKIDKKYADLLNIELKYCRSHLDAIYKKAQKTYNIGCNKNHQFFGTCCDFKLLEEVYCGYDNSKIY